MHHVERYLEHTSAHCPATTPAASAMIVLLVGETYKRGLLPRLPMDCWYMILNVQNPAARAPAGRAVCARMVAGELEVDG